mmetsp:Transcript_78030/g.137663  ORF Transcript_78030/g.137663 Transcript_78030/m.137663 type:complete len:256 (-) Transcript_78030:577-1344(-)
MDPEEHDFACTQLQSDQRLQNDVSQQSRNVQVVHQQRHCRHFTGAALRALRCFGPSAAATRVNSACLDLNRRFLDGGDGKLRRWIVGQGPILHGRHQFRKILAPHQERNVVQRLRTSKEQVHNRKLHKWQLLGHVPSDVAFGQHKRKGDRLDGEARGSGPAAGHQPSAGANANPVPQGVHHKPVTVEDVGPLPRVLEDVPHADDAADNQENEDPVMREGSCEGGLLQLHEVPAASPQPVDEEQPLLQDETPVGQF